MRQSRSRLRERIRSTLVAEGCPSLAALDTEVKITASDGATDDRFGYSVAISGDTAVVGARFDDNNGADSGAV